jgi:Pin2-interacting protein X1
MTIVASQETRNSEWANNSFGRKMLEKMGWKGDGVGLGKNQQGTSTHLRAIKRAESLGIGAETDAFGDSGWQQTNAAFHGVLANLKKEHSNISSGSDDGDDNKEARKKRKKEEKKRKKKEEKRRAKAAADGGGSSSASGSGIRLAQNKVQAGHARKMREAKDIRSKSAQDMAAIFGVKADFYKQPREWTTTATPATPSEEKDASNDAVTDAPREEEAQEELIKERKKTKKSKEKKKRKHSPSSEEDTKQKKKKKQKSKK